MFLPNAHLRRTWTVCSPTSFLETPCPESCWASFSFVGYENLELSCKDILANDGVVLLEPRAEALDAVVVTASIAGSTVQEETVPVTVLKLSLRKWERA